MPQSLELSLTCLSHHILQGTAVGLCHLFWHVMSHESWNWIEGNSAGSLYFMDKAMVSPDFPRRFERPLPSLSSLEELSGRSLRTASRASRWIQIPSMRETWRCWGNAPGSRCGGYIFRTFRAGGRNLKQPPWKNCTQCTHWGRWSLWVWGWWGWWLLGSGHPGFRSTRRAPTSCKRTPNFQPWTPCWRPCETARTKQWRWGEAGLSWHLGLGMEILWIWLHEVKGLWTYRLYRMEIDESHSQDLSVSTWRPILSPSTNFANALIQISCSILQLKWQASLPQLKRFRALQRLLSLQEDLASLARTDWNFNHYWLFSGNSAGWQFLGHFVYRNINGLQVFSGPECWYIYTIYVVTIYTYIYTHINIYIYI